MRWELNVSEISPTEMKMINDEKVLDLVRIRIRLEIYYSAS